MTAATTREKIVEKADIFFYETGYGATSFADIAEAVGISRGNFYHHFKTKDDILAAVLALRADRTRAMLQDWQTRASEPGEAILSFTNMLIANRSSIMEHGCPVGTLCYELAKLDHVAKGPAAAIFALFRDWLSGQFRALGMGERAEELAMQLLAWSQGVAVMATAFHDENFIRQEVARIEQWLAGLPRTLSSVPQEHPCSSHS